MTRQLYCCLSFIIDKGGLKFCDKIQEKLDLAKFYGAWGQLRYIRRFVIVRFIIKREHCPGRSVVFLLLLMIHLELPYGCDKDEHR